MSHPVAWAIGGFGALKALDKVKGFMEPHVCAIWRVAQKVGFSWKWTTTGSSSPILRLSRAFMPPGRLEPPYGTGSITSIGFTIDLAAVSATFLSLGDFSSLLVCITPVGTATKTSVTAAPKPRFPRWATSDKCPTERGG